MIKFKNYILLGFLFGLTFGLNAQNTCATATPVTDPAPSAKPAVAKKVTITCVKGKTVKKVTAVKPVCPAGFKKK